HDKTIEALNTLYTGFEHPLSAVASTTFSALDQAAALAAAGDHRPAVTYPNNEFARGMAAIARLIKGDVGLRVACIDLGGWDHHANMGGVDGGQMTAMLTDLAATLRAFIDDLGARVADVTIVAVTE